MRRGTELGLSMAVTAGLAFSVVACADSDPTPTPLVSGGLQEAADTLNDGGEVMGMALDVVVFPEDGIRGEEGAYFPFATSVGESDLELAVADCNNQGEVEFYEVDIDEAQMIARWAERGSGNLVPFDRDQLATPTFTRVVLDKHCTIAPVEGGFGEESVAYIGTPRG